MDLQKMLYLQIYLCIWLSVPGLPGWVAKMIAEKITSKIWDMSGKMARKIAQIF